MRRLEFQNSKAHRHQCGFALIACVLMMVLLTLLAVGLMSLSSIVLRRGGAERDMASARANARVALMSAIGQLQRELGPDQRISATSEILGESGEKHWTGVWSTRAADGSAHVVRDPETGALMDTRIEGGWDAAEEVRAWLVSGGATPGAVAGKSIELVGEASVGDEEESMIRVPVVALPGEGERLGGMAWWSGDLGVRANVATPDRYVEDELNPSSPGPGYYRLLASQQAEPELLGDGITIDSEERELLASQGTVGLAGDGGSNWAKKHFHDFTVSSSGVLADVRNGGLKGDLTAYFQSDGEIAGKPGLAGISDDTPLLAEAATSRHQLAGPRLGVLRDWAISTAPFSGEEVQAVATELDPDGDTKDSDDLALCNASPTQLKGTTSTSIQPILVEATNFLQISCFQIATTPTQRFQLRHHFYPRVVLWNPYNVELKFDPAMVMIQGNGRQEMWTENEHYDSRGRLLFRSQGQWLSFEGGRSTQFVLGGKDALMGSKGYNDPYMGSYYFSIPETTFGPGECLVFSPAKAAEYDGLSAYRPGAYNLANNELSCEVAPDASKSFYVSGTDIEEDGISFKPVRFWYAPTPYWSKDGQGVRNQSDDTRVVMKAMSASSTSDVTFDVFDALPQLAYISASLQYGSGREPRIQWDDEDRMDMETLDRTNPRPRLEPDVRTREGIRLRWFDEHQSNTENAGGLANQENFFEEAPLANWNPRAAYSVRSPWENLGGSLPTTGSAGGPWFFGIYTRDLYDDAVSWRGQVPIFQDGRYHGNPFGPPQEGQERYVMFELPRTETGVISMGQLQNAKLSEFVWHPSFPLGNSMVDPRLGLTGMDRTIPESGSSSEEQLGGFHRNAIGWSSEKERSEGRDAWASTARALLQGTPDEDQLVYDLSYEANHGLWDRYFLSSGTSEEKTGFVANPVSNPLPNGRMSLAKSTQSEATAERVADYHRAAYHLMVDGAFNVNSTSVEAWKAMLAATRAAGAGEVTPFARMLNAVEGEHEAGSSASDETAWSGFRTLSDDEIEILAEEIVVEVKKRGPFLSMSDFVNRRLSRGETGLRGALQAAIDHAGLNRSFEAGLALDNSRSLGDYRHPDHIKDATRLEQTLKPKTMGWGAPGFLTQGDVLQVLAPVLTVRSDSFVVRAYGETTNQSGEVLARAWCEAVVQRTPKPIRADSSGLNSEDGGEDGDFGRRFEIVSFRWLQPEEV